ncbi:MAG: hypothetical protein IT331_25735 [Anaerolineae bacterium]|nr:hypothetical protein [Anaerolineae bacterium]
MAEDTARSVEESVKAAVAKISQYVSDIAELEVETRYLVIGADGNLPVGADGKVDFAQANAAALSQIKIDGDCYTVVPIRKTADGDFVFQETLNQVHERNVAAAVQYRKDIVEALKDVVVELGRKIV